MNQRVKTIYIVGTGWMACVLFVYAIFCGVAWAVDVNYFSTVREARCPETHARGLVVGSSALCVKATGQTAATIKTGGVIVRISGNCPAQTGTLTSVAVYFPSESSESITSTCTYTSGTVAASGGAVVVVGDQISQTEKFTAWCVAPHTFGMRVRPTSTDCRDEDGAIVAQSDRDNPDAVVVQMHIVCASKLGLVVAEYRGLSVGGTLTSDCLYSDASGGSAQMVSIHVQPRTEVVLVRTALVIVNVLSFLSSIAIGWKLSVRPSLEVMT